VLPTSRCPAAEVTPFTGRRRGLDLLTTAIRPVVDSRREAVRIAQSIRDGWLEALLDGKLVQVPMGILQVVWRKHDRRPRHRSGVLKQFGRMPPTWYHPGRQRRVAFRADGFVQWEPHGRARKWVPRKPDRRGLQAWTPGQAASDALSDAPSREFDLQQLRALLVEKHEIGSFQALDIIRAVCASVRSAIESGHDFVLRGFGTWRSATSKLPTSNTIRFKASPRALRRIQAAEASD
jgi:hypothetical protein